MFGALKPGFRSLATLKLVVMFRRTLSQKEQLRHSAVSLRQHGFLVSIVTTVLYCIALCDFMYFYYSVLLRRNGRRIDDDDDDDELPLSEISQVFAEKSDPILLPNFIVLPLAIGR